MYTFATQRARSELELIRDRCTDQRPNPRSVVGRL